MSISVGVVFLHTKVPTYKDVCISDCSQFYGVLEWRSVGRLSFASLTVFLSKSGDGIINVSAVALPYEKLYTGNREVISISVIYIFVALIVCRANMQSTGIPAEI